MYYFLQKSTQWNNGHVKKGSRLYLTKVTRKDAGQYICIASNDVGSPAKQESTLRVHCKCDFVCFNIFLSHGKIFLFH